MIKLKKITIIILLLFLASSCSGSSSSKTSIENVRTGTEGISMAFLPNNPPDVVHAEKDYDTFDVTLEMRNNGAYPQPDENNKLGLQVYLSGFDKNIVDIPQAETMKISNGLLGKSTINPLGGLDLLTFKGKINIDKLNVQIYEPILMATACYRYETTAGPQVCIDPDPYAEIREKQVCMVSDAKLSSQGAPVAVTEIGEEAMAEKTQFKITIKNVGNGDVLTSDAAETKCNPGVKRSEGASITREDVNKVFLQSVKVADVQLECGPFTDQAKGTVGYIRLINNEGFVLCNLEKSRYDQYKRSSASFTTPLVINLVYGYRNTIQRKLTIKKETSGISIPPPGPYPDQI